MQEPQFKITRYTPKSTNTEATIGYDEERIEGEDFAQAILDFSSDALGLNGNNTVPEIAYIPNTTSYNANCSVYLYDHTVRRLFDTSDQHLNDLKLKLKINHKKPFLLIERLGGMQPGELIRRLDRDNSPESQPSATQQDMLAMVQAAVAKKWNTEDFKNAKIKQELDKNAKTKQELAENAKTKQELAKNTKTKQELAEAFNKRFWLSIQTATLPWKVLDLGQWLMKPGNYAFSALVFLSIALIIAKFASPIGLPAQLFALSTLPILGGFVITVLFSFLFEVYPHYNAQRYKSWKNQPENQSLTYEDYLKDLNQNNYTFGFKDYLLSLVPLMQKNKILTGLIVVATILSIFLAAGIGFFLGGNPFYTHLLHPFVDLMGAVFSPFMSVGTMHIVAPIIVSLIPLILVDAIRRMVEVVDDANEHATHEDYGVNGSEYSPEYYVYAAAEKALYNGGKKKSTVFTDVNKPAEPTHPAVQIGAIVVVKMLECFKLVKILDFELRNKPPYARMRPIDSKGDPESDNWLPIEDISPDLMVVKSNSPELFNVGDYLIVHKDDWNNLSTQNNATIEVWRAEHGIKANGFTQDGHVTGDSKNIGRCINGEAGYQVSVEALTALEESDNAPYKSLPLKI